MTKQSADFWIKHLHLTRHIEGGSFSEVYRSPLIFSADSLPGKTGGNRNACTHIYFLLEKEQFSAFHRIRFDELWHFYTGDPLTVYEIDDTGALHQHLLGNDPQAGQSLFCCIKGGSWFGSKVNDGGTYSLVGCTVAPGFDFDDFELAKREELMQQYPAHKEIITALSNK
jgi:predicted cupin superfamily sugar epimerase